jgi:hypothetical protein
MLRFVRVSFLRGKIPTVPAITDIEAHVSTIWTGDAETQIVLAVQSLTSREEWRGVLDIEFVCFRPRLL